MKAARKRILRLLTGWAVLIAVAVGGWNRWPHLAGYCVCWALIIAGRLYHACIDSLDG